MRALLVVLLLARTAEAGPCVPRDANAEDARIDRDGVTVCYDECWRLAAGHWSIVPAPPPEAPPLAPKITLATKLSVCHPDCRDLVLPGVAAINASDVIERADRSMIAVRGDPRSVYVFDAGGALLSTIHPWKTAMGDPASIQRVAFVDGALLVAVSSSPVSSQGRLYDARTGKLLASIGGKAAELDDQVALDLGGHRWAFGAFDSNELYVYDATTGKRLASITVGAKGSGYRALQVAGRRLVGVHSTARGGVTLYDLDKRKASSEVVPLCK